MPPAIVAVLSLLPAAAAVVAIAVAWGSLRTRQETADKRADERQAELRETLRDARSEWTTALDAHRAESRETARATAAKLDALIAADAGADRRIALLEQQLEALRREYDVVADRLARLETPPRPRAR